MREGGLFDFLETLAADLKSSQLAQAQQQAIVIAIAIRDRDNGRQGTYHGDKFVKHCSC